MLRKTAVVVFDGNNFGTDSGPFQDGKFAGYLAQDLSFQVEFASVAGFERTLADCLGDYDKSVAPLRNYNAPLSVVVINAGSDEILGGKSAADTYEELSQYVAKAHAQGWKVVALELQAASIYSDAIRSEIAKYNVLLAGNTAGVDGILSAESKHEQAAGSSKGDGGSSARDEYANLAGMLGESVARLWDNKEERENVILFGEVQILAIYRHLLDVFQKTQSDRYALEFVDSNDDYAPQIVSDLLKRPGRVVLQINPDRSVPHRRILETMQEIGATQALKVPMLQCRSLWPFDRYDHEIHEFNSFASGTQGDDTLRKLVKQKNSAKLAATEYSNTDIGTLIDLKAIFQNDISQWKSLEKESDVVFSDYLVHKFTSQKFFNSHKLPSNPAIKIVIDRIRKFLDFDEEQIRVSNDLLNETDLLQPDTPIHPSIANHLNLGWLKKNTLYSIFGKKTDYQRWAFEYAKFYEFLQDRSGYADDDVDVHGDAQAELRASLSRTRSAPKSSINANSPSASKMSSVASFFSNIPGRIRRMEPLLLICVAIPTLLSAIYFTIFAADVYVSQSTFLVRTPNKNNQSGSFVGALLQSTGLSRASDDTYAVNDYLISRDALTALNKNNAYSDAYGQGQGDLFSRFGSFGYFRTFEDLFRYFQHHVDAQYDTDTGITTLEVNAFSAADARMFNEKLLELGEQRVNEMNNRAKQDLIVYARNEVESAEANLKKSAAALSSYRDKQAIFDPERQSALALQNVIKIQNELIAAKIQLAQLKSVSPANPQIPALNVKIATLQTTVDKASSEVTGGQGSFAFKSPAYERLELDRQFADRQLTASLASLETARNDAQRQQLYLERISQPNEPDKALLPHRLRNIIATLIIGLVVWGTLKLLIASVKEHHD